MKKIAPTIKISLVVMIVLAALLSLFFVFLFTDFGMMVNSDGLMGDCPFNPNGSLCTMNFQEHMNLWQSMFTALPQKTTMVSLMLFAVWLLITTFVFKNLLLEHYKLLFSNYRLYTKQYSYISLIDPVKRAIYQGLITPKIF